MEIILRERRAGKTTEIIKRCAKLGGYIVCCNHSRALEVRLIAKKMGLRVPLPITFQEFLDGSYYGKGVKGFHIDDLDVCLQQICAVPIETVTAAINKQSAPLTPMKD